MHRTSADATWTAGRQESIGLHERLEPVVRRIVADGFRVPEARLHPHVSFDRDLSVDPVRLTELVVKLERSCEVTLSDLTIDRMRTYGDLVERVVEARRRADRDLDARANVFLRAMVVPGPGSHRGTMTRSGWWSPYAKAILVDDARHAGVGATLTIMVPPSAPLGVAERIARELADLTHVGVHIDVRHARVGRGRAVV